LLDFLSDFTLKTILAVDIRVLLRVLNFNFGEKVNCRNLPLTQNFFSVFQKHELGSLYFLSSKFLKNNAGTYNVFKSFLKIQTIQDAEFHGLTHFLNSAQSTASFAKN